MNYDSVYEKIGKKIKATRLKNRISQEELGALAGLNRAYMGDVERGRNISIKTLYKIAKALKVSSSEILPF